MRYKKHLVTLLIVATLFTCLACNKGKQEEPTVDSNNKVNYVYDTTITQLSESYNVAYSENGYYFTVNGILHFYDVANDVSLPVCSKLECSHNSSSCDAYACDDKKYDVYDLTGIVIDCLGNTVWYHDDKLYMMKRDEAGDYLMQYDSDYTNEVKLCTLADNGAVVGAVGSKVEYKAKMYNGYIYYYASRPVHVDTMFEKDYMLTITCNRIKMEKNAVPEELGSFDFAMDYAIFSSEKSATIVVSDDSVYFVACGTKRYMSDKNPVQFRLCRYSCEEEQFTTILTKNTDNTMDILGAGSDNILHGISGRVCIDDENNIYIPTQFNDVISITKITPSGEIKKIYTSNAAKDIQSLTWDGTYIYFAEELSTGANLVRLNKDGTERSNYFIAINEEFCEAHGMKISQSLLSGSINILGIDNTNIIVSTKNDYLKGLECEATISDQFLNVDITAVGIIPKEAFNDKTISVTKIYEYKK